MQDIASFTLHARLVRAQKDGHRAIPAEVVASTLKDLATRWEESWIKQPAFIQGSDEISAVLRSPRHAFDFAVAMNLAAWPLRYQVRVTSTGIEMMQGAVPGKGSKKLFTLRLHGFPVALQELIESSAQLHANIMRDWKPSRAAASSMIRKAETQQRAATALGIRQQSVSDALSAAHAKDLVALEDAVRNCLTTLLA